MVIQLKDGVSWAGANLVKEERSLKNISTKQNQWAPGSVNNQGDLWNI